jgi:hypothetical protein
MQNAPYTIAHPRGGRQHKLLLIWQHNWWHIGPIGTFAFVLAQHTTTQLEKDDTFSFVMTILNVQENIAVGEMPRRHLKNINSKVPI